MRPNDTGTTLSGVVKPVIRELGPPDIEPLLSAMAADGLDVRPDAGIWIGAVMDGDVAGVVHIFRCGDHDVVDDVWTVPSARRQGIATLLLNEAASRFNELWLITDRPDIAYYEGRGFALVPHANLPLPLADYYESKDEWPVTLDHAHYAMVKRSTRQTRSSAAERR